MANEKEYDFLGDLIANVQQNKCLYDKKDVFYFNRIKKDAAWADIASKVKKTSQECRNKWKLLRERFARELKKQAVPNETGEYQPSEWVLFHQMAFLQSSVKPRNRSSAANKPLKIENVSGSADFFSGYADDLVEDMAHNSAAFDDTIEASSQSSTQPESKHGKSSFEILCEQMASVIQKLEQQTRPSLAANIGECDQDELFMRTVLSLMKDLPIAARDQLKADIFTKVIQTRAECRSEQE